MLQRRPIAEGQLQADQQQHHSPDHGIVAQGEARRRRQPAAAEQVTDLRGGQPIDGQRATGLQAPAQLLRVEEQAKDGTRHQQGDEQHPPAQLPAQQGRARISGRAAHQVGLGRLEGQGQGQGDGGDHVDPEDLQGGDGQCHAHGDCAEQHQGLTRIGRQYEQQRFLQVVVDRATFFDGVAKGGEVVVGQHHLRRLLSRLGALDAHGHADIGAFERRGVVDPVAGHRHPCATGLQALHQAQLVCRAGAGENAGLLQPSVQFAVAHAVQFGAGQCRGAAQAEALGDDAGGAGMVAGDHLHGDARAVALGDGLDDFLAWRIEHADQAQQNEVALQVRVVQFMPGARECAQAQPEHAQALTRALFEGGVPVPEVQGFVAAIAPLPVAHLQQAFRGAHQVDHGVTTVVVVQAGGAAALGAEGNHVDSRQVEQFGLALQLEFAGQGQQGRFGGVAADPPVVSVAGQAGIVGQQSRARQLAQVGGVVRLQAVLIAEHRARRRVAGAFDPVVMGAGEHLLHGHLVARQGSGLVRADHTHGTEAFHCRQLADDRLARGHAPHAQGQNDRQHRRQPLRDRRHGKADGRHQHLPGAVIAQQHTKGEGTERQHQDDQRQMAGEARHIREQRGLQADDLAQHVTDLAQLGIPGGRHHYASTRAGHDQGAGIGHAASIAQAGFRGHWLDLFLRWQRFAGQRRFLDAQVAALQQPEVRRYAIAGFQQHQVAAHQLGGRQALDEVVAAHAAFQAEHSANRPHRLLGLALLNEADQRVDQRHGKDDQAIQPFAEHQGQQRGQQQHIDQQVVELTQKAFERSVRAPFGQSVGAFVG